MKPVPEFVLSGRTGVAMELDVVQARVAAAGLIGKSASRWERLARWGGLCRAWLLWLGAPTAAARSATCGARNLPAPVRAGGLNGHSPSGSMLASMNGAEWIFSCPDGVRVPTPSADERRPTKRESVLGFRSSKGVYERGC